jgi:peptidoglycan/xylan/chitin deacetylase (PgdA/CDA1 family)
MRPGWYIINYHDVDYEDSILTRALGLTTRPDVFGDHLEQMAELGRFVSIDEGCALLESDGVDEPLFSVWFDDGYAGVADEAFDLCQNHGVPAALSICSRFALRKAMFWQAQLSYLAATDGLRVVRSRLRKLYDDVPMRLKRWTIEAFSEPMVEIIDEVYQELAHEEFRRDAFRIFADEDRVARLARAGWRIANHGAAHYPVNAALDGDAVVDQFLEGRELVESFGASDRYWAIPFGFAEGDHRARLAAHATIVETGNKVNTPERWRRTKSLIRFEAPVGRDLVAALR